ncbi:HNH endonuclease [Stenotrophomonas sp.]|uniref:HNH endonuclease n=1 Tax=Stenotrophomonas sp. TaxID=69392 RepID=UPI0028A891E2|nr:HNH endonuclease [Stenotrophomonas sp.]
MLISKDHHVAALGLSLQESAGLDVAVAELRRALGPLDAYIATYARNGMSGPTLILGRKDPGEGKRGNPLFAIRKMDGKHFLGFTLRPERDRKVLQGHYQANAWEQVSRGRAWLLETLAGGKESFVSDMTALGSMLAADQPDFLERRVQGRSRVPTDYSASVSLDEGGEDLIRDLDELKSLPPTTTRQQLVDARLGQGKFRRDVLALWGGRCAVTGCDVQEVVKASHVQPWACTSAPSMPGVVEPRLDANNGLPLVATLDALFDRGLITFNDDGRVRFADSDVEEDLVNRGMVSTDMCLTRTPNAALRHYLSIHRRVVFEGWDE